ncbi:hypothetical protein D3C71_994140 [compost metagenome]
MLDLKTVPKLTFSEMLSTVEVRAFTNSIFPNPRSIKQHTEIAIAVLFNRKDFWNKLEKTK